MKPFCWADHACRFCGSRLGLLGEGPNRVYECGNCSLASVGGPELICGCGVHLGSVLAVKGERVPTPTGPRFYCEPNAQRSVTNPSAIVIVYGEPAAKPLPAT